MTRLHRYAALILLAISLQTIAAEQTVRPEVGTPLQEAQTQLQDKKYPEALAKIDQAEAVGNLTPYESYIVARMRSAAATGAGDYATAGKAYDAVLASKELPEADRRQTLEALAKVAYTAKSYGKAADTLKQYRDAGGNDAQTLALLPQALYLGNKFQDAYKELNAQLGAMEKAGQTPTEQQIQLLASCALKQNDNAGYIAALEKMVAHHPKDSYWLDLIVRTSNKPGFSDRLSLDVYRLRKQTKTMQSAADYMEAAQLALQAGLPGEAQQYVDAGYAAKQLGQGPDASRHQRLKDLVAKKLQEDKVSLADGEKAATAQPSGDALINTGLNYVGYSQFDKGVALIEQGIKKGNLKKPDDAKLHLGYAQVLASKKDDASKIFKSVQGNDGARDLARLWMLRANRP
jgi:hypothetical protein